LAGGVKLSPLRQWQLDLWRSLPDHFEPLTVRPSGKLPVLYLRAWLVLW